MSSMLPVPQCRAPEPGARALLIQVPSPVRAFADSESCCRRCWDAGLMPGLREAGASLVGGLSRYRPALTLRRERPTAARSKELERVTCARATIVGANQNDLMNQNDVTLQPWNVLIIRKGSPTSTDFAKDEFSVYKESTSVCWTGFQYDLKVILHIMSVCWTGFQYDLKILRESSTRFRD